MRLLEMKKSRLQGPIDPRVIHQIWKAEDLKQGCD